MALKRIVLKDFVIVQALELDLHAGFTALTGETGAGKSILIDALQLILGSRADANTVREGAQRADLCAEFDTPPTLIPWLEEAGFAISEDLLLRRTIDATGKSRAWINGSPATAAQLRHLGEQQLDIHGQHAWQSLMRAGAIRDLLDAYAGTSTDACTQHWTLWQCALKACEEAHNAQEQRQQECERLQWQLAEIDKLAPGANEWTDLIAQHTRLTHAQSLLETAHAARNWLDSENGGARTQLARAADILARQEHIEPIFQNLTAALASALAQTDDALHSLHNYLDRSDTDPQQLQELDTRVAAWMTLARRYKCLPEALPALRQSWQNTLHALETASDLTTLTAQAHAHGQAYHAAAQTLSHARTQAAPRLSAQITSAMQELGMAGGQFVVQIQPAATAAAHGIDDIDFLVAGHPGATPRPIARIASGGELARISLAIAVATSALGNADTLIFDEVDAGIGGATATSVGLLMRSIGQDRQVLAVTHLPQVAACAHHHLVVTKNRGEPTTSQVTAVQGDLRVHEVARMLGGEHPTKSSLTHAREMLALAPQRKQA